MVELKTLKEMQGYEASIAYGEPEMNEEEDGYYINRWHLKKEAIKILKADTKDLCDFLGVKELDEKELKVIDLIIKKGYNITEEDLK